VDEVTTAWLTAVLQARGALRAGAVASLDREVAGSSWSKRVHLRPRYEASALGERPPALLLKICAGAHAVFGPSEVLYYTRDYRGYERAPIPRCYDAAYREDPRAYHVLLEDLSETHCDGFCLEPTLELGRSIADALARLHARYWAGQRLAGIGARIAGAPELERYFAHIGKGLEPLFDVLGDALTPGWRQILDDVFANHPRVMQRRARDAVGFSLVHGDVNPGNVLTPRQGSGPVYLIDRQPFDWSLQGWLGASDLARLMVLYWEPEQRRRWQFPILRQYQTSLQECGIDFAWEALLFDYRLCVVEGVESAVEWLVLPDDRSSKRWLWERQLERSMAAYSELECAELWSGLEPELP
jgi:hypothetical protein